MAKNLVLGMIFAPLAQIWIPKIFFHRFYLYNMLGIVASCHCMQFQKMTEKPLVLGPILGPNSGRQFYFFFFFKNLAPSVTKW